MKKLIMASALLALYITACNTQSGSSTGTSDKDSTKASSITLPYKANYTTEFNNDVSDSDLLMVLNSYKYWETGDLTGLRSTMGDSMYVSGADGFKFAGLTDSLMKIWTAHRDSISSVSISMDVWLKNHSLKDSADYVNVWYKEIDTYKSGKVDSANYEDINSIRNGKLIWYSSYKQILK